MKLLPGLSFSTLLVIAGLTALSGVAKATILPENNLFVFDDKAKIANITEEQFNTIIKEVIDFYIPLAKMHGATLTSNNNWTDSTVNAYAQQSGTTWTVSMFGGLARRDEVTADGFTMVVCHEIGHHFGGFAFIGSSWAAAEGQADYYATETCAKAIWGKQTAQNAEHIKTVNAIAKAGCDKSWKTEDERNLCYRTSDAGSSLANLLAALGSKTAGMPKFDTPDKKQVTTTDTAHPKAQCRLDTYYQGALCGKSVDLTVIPGRNHPAGQGSMDAEKEASKYSCFASAADSTGSRPRCWFKPRVVGSFVD